MIHSAYRGFLCLSCWEMPSPASSQSNAAAHHSSFVGSFQEIKITTQKEEQIPVLGKAAKPGEAPPSLQVRPAAASTGFRPGLGVLSMHPFISLTLFSSETVLYFLVFVLYFLEASTEAEIRPYHVPHGNKEAFLSGE